MRVKFGDVTRRATRKAERVENPLSSWPVGGHSGRDVLAISPASICGVALHNCVTDGHLYVRTLDEHHSCV
jgi:hypothetical protein